MRGLCTSIKASWTARLSRKVSYEKGRASYISDQDDIIANKRP